MPEPKGPLCWIVLRDFQLTMPAGFAYAAPLLQFPLARDRSSPELRAAMWGAAVAPVIRAVVLVSSVPVRVGAQGRSHWPDSVHCPPRQQSEWLMAADTVLSLAPQQQWPGEVLAVPLKVIDVEAAAGTHLGAFLRRQLNQGGAGQ